MESCKGVDPTHHLDEFKRQITKDLDIKLADAHELIVRLQSKVDIDAKNANDKYQRLKIEFDIMKEKDHPESGEIATASEQYYIILKKFMQVNYKYKQLKAEQEPMEHALFK